MGSGAFFEQQRGLLLGEISVAMESVLTNINKLNRSIEGVLAVGRDFESVEQLWSQFDHVSEKPAAPEPSRGEDGVATREESDQRSSNG